MKRKIVWEFTNKRKLTADDFIKYFEKKVKATIRKYNMPIKKIKKNNLKSKIINSIIKNLPERKGKISDESLNNLSNKIIYVMMHGRKSELGRLLPRNQPLYFLSDKEILLYAKLKKIKGKIKEEKQFREVNKFIETIETKNPDIRHNIVTSLLNNLF